jgi:hypothetical protein
VGSVTWCSSNGAVKGVTQVRALRLRELENEYERLPTFKDFTPDS